MPASLRPPDGLLPSGNASSARGERASTGAPDGMRHWQDGTGGRPHPENEVREPGRRGFDVDVGAVLSPPLRNGAPTGRCRDDGVFRAQGHQAGGRGTGSVGPSRIGLWRVGSDGGVAFDAGAGACRCRDGPETRPCEMVSRQASADRQGMANRLRPDGGERSPPRQRPDPAAASTPVQALARGSRRRER